MVAVLNSCNSCCNPIDVNDGDEISVFSKGCCYHYDNALYDCTTSLGITFTNLSGSLLHIKVYGIVNDDVMFNGVVYEDGDYCYWSPDCPGGITPCTYTNGAHSFEYNSTISNGSSILIQNVDNGYDGGIDCHINFS